MSALGKSRHYCEAIGKRVLDVPVVRLRAVSWRGWDGIFSETVVLGDIMKQNIHNVERVVRVIVGLAIISLVFIGPQSVWGWLGLIPLATGIIGWCPPYALFGFSTCKKAE